MNTLTTIIVSTISGLAVLAIAGIYTQFFTKKKPKSILQKIFQFGFGNNAKNNITNKDTKED